MFDEQQSGRFEPNVKPPLIVIACGSGGAVLSFGLCGVAGAIPETHSTLGAGLGVSGIAVFGISVISIIVGCISLLIAIIVNAFRK